MSWKDILKGEEMHPSIRGYVATGQKKIKVLERELESLRNKYNTVPLNEKEEKETMKKIKDISAEIESLKTPRKREDYYLPLGRGEDIKFLRQRESIDDKDRSVLARLGYATRLELEEKVKELTREQRINNHQRNLLNRAIYEGEQDGYKHLKELAKIIGVSFGDAFTSAKQRSYRRD